MGGGLRVLVWCMRWMLRLVRYGSTRARSLSLSLLRLVRYGSTRARSLSLSLLRLVRYG
jgi:hypothetical protein